MTPKVCILSVRIFFKRDCEWGMRKGGVWKWTRRGVEGEGRRLMSNFDDMNQYTAHRYCIKVIMQPSSAIVDFSLFYNGSVDK